MASIASFGFARVYYSLGLQIFHQFSTILLILYISIASRITSLTILFPLVSLTTIYLLIEADGAIKIKHTEHYLAKGLGCWPSLKKLKTVAIRILYKCKDLRTTVHSPWLLRDDSAKGPDFLHNCIYLSVDNLVSDVLNNIRYANKYTSRLTSCDAMPKCPNAVPTSYFSTP